MDMIARAIEKKLHISGERQLDEQTWNMFEDAIVGKKLFLFGTGGCADFFWKRYQDNLSVEGIIDNDEKKQGFAVEEFRAEAWGYSSGRIIISGIEVLKEYMPDEVVVLVLNTNAYISIMEQLREIGITNIFVYLIMEAHYRLDCQESVPDEKEQRRVYAQKCIEEPLVLNKIVLNVDFYGGHNRAITEALLEVKQDLEIVWMVKDLTIKAPKGVRVVCSENWKRYIYELETARVWIWEYCLPTYIIKRDNQYYIQVKHWSSVTLKKFTLEDKTVIQHKEIVEEAYYNSEIMDYIVVGSDFDEQSCRRGFNFHKEVIRAGSPRSDILFKGDEGKKSVYSDLNIDVASKILLYAPTFRYNQEGSKGIIPESQSLDIDFESVRGALIDRFGGEWYILLRLHPFVAKCARSMRLPEYVINASEYVDSQLLIAASDILVTDYSSIMFESAFIKRPVFLFATDRDTFIGVDRDLLIDYDTLPFPIAESNEELVQVIEQFDEQKYVEEVTSFLDFYGVHEDGHASERVAEFISELISK